MEKIAIIDMGSNSIRMVIVQVSAQAYHLIDDTKETVRLSENMGPEKTLKQAAMQRALSTLTRFLKLCRSRGVTTVIPVTTAAVRQAANQSEFLQQVRRATGLVFRVLSGEEEGYYGFLGVNRGFAEDSGFTLDIGGGSSEVTYFVNRKLRQSVSLPFGALTLTETFFDKNSANRLATEQVCRFLRETFAREEWIGQRPGLPLIGLGGTVRNIARIHRQLTGYPLESAHQYEMDKQQVDETINRMVKCSPQQLLALPGLSKDRADTIVAGGLIIQSLMEACGSPRLLISGNGLREGLLHEYLERRVGRLADRDVTMDDVSNMMHYYNIDIEHGRHVAFLSVRLFDELAALHALGGRERHLLYVAAHLHDVGVAVSFYEWPTHTFYILLHSKIAGLSHRERLLVALIASFKNRKKSRELAGPYQVLLKPGDEELVQKLGILLQMARALDRTLSNDVRDVACEITDKEIRIAVHSVTPDIGLELKEAGEIQQKFEKAFGRAYYLTMVLHTRCQR